MKQTYSTKIELSPEDLRDIIRKHFGLGVDAKVNFVVADVSDDRMDRAPRFDLVRAEIGMEIIKAAFENHLPRK